MNEEKFKTMTRTLALEVIRLVESLPKDEVVAQVIGNGLLRSATSMGANYRSACRARSNIELIAQLNTVLAEADQTVYWLELLIFTEADLVPANTLQNLLAQTNSIVNVLVASLKTLRAQSSGERIPSYLPSVKPSLLTMQQ